MFQKEMSSRLGSDIVRSESQREGLHMAFTTGDSIGRECKDRPTTMGRRTSLVLFKRYVADNMEALQASRNIQNLKSFQSNILTCSVSGEDVSGTINVLLSFKGCLLNQALVVVCAGR